MVLALSPTPIHVPPLLIQAFRGLNADPVLVGGAAIQVWTGRSDGLFLTHDLDFITPFTAADFQRHGITLERSGRHLLVDQIAVEFPSGPLGVADLILDPLQDSVEVNTIEGDLIRCLRPEACVLDRLAQAVGWMVAEAYPQALAVTVVQSPQPGWDWAWLDRSARACRLSRILDHLRSELAGGVPHPESLEQVMELGWDRP